MNRSKLCEAVADPKYVMENDTCRVAVIHGVS